MATGTVRQIIEFKGQDDASAVADKVKKSVQSLGAAGEKASKATASIDGKGIKEIQEKSGDVESALKGISDFAGDAKGQVSQLGDSFGAVEGIMRLLPGPIGLATTAVAGLAIGAKLLADYISQSAAKMELLGGPNAKALQDRLSLSADGAIKLSKAITDLKDSALTPSDTLLKQVVANAESLGKDGADAAAKFVTALQAGPEALKEFQAEFGKLNGIVSDNIALAKQIGLDPAALGLAQQLTATEQEKADVAQGLSRIRKNQLEIARAEAELDRQRILESSAFTVAKGLEAGRQKVALEEQLVNLQRIADTEREVLVSAQATARARSDQAVQLALIASRVEMLGAQAQATSDKQVRRSLESEASTARQLAAVRALNAFDTLHGKTLDAKLQTERNILQAKVFQGDAARLAAAQAAESERKAAAAAGAARARAARDARLRAGEKYEAEEVAYFADKEKTSKELSFAAIRANIKALEDQAQAEQRLVEARIGGTEDPAVKARLEIADLEARKLRELDAVRNDVTINEETRKAKLTAITVETTTKTVAIQTAADARVKASADEVAKSQREAASAALTIVGTAAQAAQAYAGPNGLAGAMAQAVTSAQTLIAGWETTKSKTADVIGAVGAVASAVVDGEREKAAVLAVTSAAQAIVFAVSGDYAKAAGYGAAAVMYGGIATGLLGGSSAAASPTASPGFGAAAQTQGQGGAPAAVGTTVINFNAPLATRYEIGKSVAEANKAAMLSGNASAKGA